MDFLRLFPSSSCTFVANNHNNFAHQSPPQLLFSAYRNLGLLCYSSAPTSRTTTATSSGKASVLFKRITSIVLSPKLPETAQFTELLVNTSGSRVALVGRRMIFVVELDTDFWHRPAALDGPDWVDHLRPEYYAKCDLLHVGLFVRKFPPSVLRVRWFEPASDFLEYFGKMPLTLPRLSSMLAVLFSDNVIRLYDVTTAMDCPLVQLDFTTLLPDRMSAVDESETSGDEFGRAHSTLGFITQLVSFDFGPPQLVAAAADGDQTVLGSLLALDSNGQLYTALFPFDGIGHCPPPKGPLPLFGFPAVSQQRLLCAALDLLHIRHPLGTQNFSVWALASEDGLLAHFVLLRELASFDALSLESANVVPSFELFAVDCVEIGAVSYHSRATKLPSKVISRLQKNEFGDRSTYLVVGESDVFRLELAALVEHLWAQCSGRSNCEKPTFQSAPVVQPSSSVHQLLMFAGGGEAPSIGSVACVEAAMDGGTSSDETQRPVQQQLVAAECSFDTKSGGRESAFLATLVSCESPSFSHYAAPTSVPNQIDHRQSNKTPLLADDVRAVLAQLQAVSAAQHHLPQSLPAAVHFDTTTTAVNNGDEEQQKQQLAQLQQRASQLLLVQQTVDQVLLQGQMPARAVALDYALKRSHELLCSLQAVERFRQSATQRLTVIFRQLNELKAKLRQKQQHFRVIEHRVVRVAQSLHPLLFPTSDAETAAADTLKQLQRKLRTCAEETVKLDERIRAHRHALCAGTPCSSSFASSSSHQQQQQRPLAFIPAPCVLHSSHPPPLPPSATTNGIPAQMFMLSKNGRECAKLREMVASLSAQLDGSGGTSRTAAAPARRRRPP
uniref:Nuclear pore complex protein Nup88 n=1 Tax=Globodera rostochiensis TaxID=31243 RepID=A0A914IGT0_GLORO